jgi:transposase-like protein
MTDEIRALKRDLGRGERGRGKRYPAALKQRVVRWALQRKVGGATWPAIAEELDLGLDTVRRWCIAAEGCERPSRALVPVRVVSRPAATGATASVVSLSGWRVDGLTVAEAAAMLRTLG